METSCVTIPSVEGSIMQILSGSTVRKCEAPRRISAIDVIVAAYNISKAAASNAFAYKLQKFPELNQHLTYNQFNGKGIVH